MVTVAEVIIWNTSVGAIAWNENTNYAVFEFDKNFLKKNLDLAPVMMPLNEALAGNGIFSFPRLNKDTYKGLPGMLADSLPDKYGNNLINIWLAQKGRPAESFTPVERLCYIGKRGMGALEFEPATDSFSSKGKNLDVNDLAKLAEEIISERKKLKATLKGKEEKELMEIIRVGSSAGGARAKAIIAYNEETEEVRSGQIDGLSGYEYWIIKFDGVTDKALSGPQGYCRREYAYYLMAKNCGIEMSKCLLYEENNRAHFMTKRFDRKGTKKIHMQTLCAIAHYDYNAAGYYSYEQAFEVMRRLKLPHNEMEQLYKRMVFNVIARNQDDHTKNISFLMDEGGVWKLAPAYDLTYALDPENKWLMAHQMRINGKIKDIVREDLIDVAKVANIKKHKLIIEEVINTASEWNKFATIAGVEKEQIIQIQKHLKLNI